MPKNTERPPGESGPRQRRGRLPSGEPHPIDIHVGARMRERRMLIGMSQEQLGQRIGITFQQIQKYERGINRIGSSRLYDLAQVLEVPVSYFFGELGSEGDGRPFDPNRRPGVSGEEPPSLNLPTRREALDLARAYHAIEDPRIRRRLLDMVKSLANAHH